MERAALDAYWATMEEIEYRKMFAYEDDHWWFRGKRAIVAGMIRRFAPPAGRARILDVGCGTGANLRALGSFGTTFGTDLHPLALALCRERGVRNVLRATAERLPYAAGSFDVVVLLDVLYHRAVDDVDAALAEAHRVCRPGGCLVITDSALEWLRSPHDVAYHAARRFDRRELAARVTQSGFVVVKRSYMNALLFPLALVSRLVDRVRLGRDGSRSSLGRVHPAANRVLAGIYGLEARLLRHVSFPIGLSVLLVARKSAARSDGARADAAV